MLRRADRQDCLEAETRLQEMEDLNLSAQSLSDLRPLASLTHLTRLDLSVNEIEDISPLQELTQLEEVLLSINEIEDISPPGISGEFASS